MVLVPGTISLLPLVCETDKSICDADVFISVALSLAELVSITPLGGETETIFVMEPVAVGSIVPERVMVTLSPEARLKLFQMPEFSS